MKITITDWKYIYEKDFDESAFRHRDSRLMDKHMKMAVTMVREFHSLLKQKEIPPELLGIAFSFDGPLESIAEYNGILRKNGYIGINPSKFPNIMPATPLARMAIEAGAKGPCISLISSDKHAFIYAEMQIIAKRCCAVMVICLHESKGYKGCLMYGGQ